MTFTAFIFIGKCLTARTVEVVGICGDCHGLLRPRVEAVQSGRLAGLASTLMRSFLFACLAVAVIGILAAVILVNAVQEPASAAFSTTSVRL